MSFEESLEELEGIVSRMESEQLPLTELIDQYEKGSRLYIACDEMLGKARKRLDLITLKAREHQEKNHGSASGNDAADEESTDDDDIRLF